MCGLWASNFDKLVIEKYFNFKCNLLMSGRKKGISISFSILILAGDILGSICNCPIPEKFLKQRKQVEYDFGMQFYCFVLVQE